MFNYKKFLCAVPAPVLRDYLGERQFEGTDDFNWSAPEDVFVKALGAVIDDGDAERRSALISDLQEAADLADEPGFRAILNRAGDGRGFPRRVEARQRADSGQACRNLIVLGHYMRLIESAPDQRIQIALVEDPQAQAAYRGLLQLGALRPAPAVSELLCPYCDGMRVEH